MYRMRRYRSDKGEMSQKEKQLMVAVDKGHTKLIETLILQGTSVNCRVKVSTFGHFILPLKR